MRTTGFVDTVPSQPGAGSIEEVVGPVCGYYLASYTVEAEDGYYAYAKLCIDKPRSVWQAAAVRKVAAGPYASPEAAITGVVDLVIMKLSRKREEEHGLQYAWRATEPGDLPEAEHDPR
jgi:hypothetical protein